MGVGPGTWTSLAVSPTTVARRMELPSDLVNGYPRIAAQMAHNRELGMLRTFEALSMQNLLYQQAVIGFHETRLRAQEGEDCKSADGIRNRYCQNCLWLCMFSPNDEQPSQWDTVSKLRELLREYRTSHRTSTLALPAWSEKDGLWC